mgnify:FL=1
MGSIGGTSSSSSILRFNHESNNQTWIPHGNMLKERCYHAIGVVRTNQIVRWCQGENGTLNINPSARYYPSYKMYEPSFANKIYEPSYMPSYNREN